jgi:hypothetical protein
MSMQVDDFLKKEQIGTLFVLVGAPEGGVWGGGGAGGSTPKSKCATKKINTLLLSSEIKHPPSRTLS